MAGIQVIVEDAQPINVRLGDTVTVNQGGDGGSTGGDTVLDISMLTPSYYMVINDQWQDTGLSVTLPEAGDYVINMNAGGGLVTSADGSNGVQGRLYNVTDDSVVPNSTGYFVATNCTTSIAEFGQINLEVPITVTSETVIRLEAYLNNSAVTSVGLISGDDAGDGTGVNISRLKVTKRA